MCKRTVIARRVPPRLERLGSRTVLLGSTRPVASPMSTQPVLAGQYHQAGRSWLIEGSLNLLLNLQGLQLYPALRGEKEFSTRIPVLFTPAVPAASSADEMDILRQMSFENGTHLEELSFSISSHHIEADENTLIRLRASSLQRASKGYWITCGPTATGIVLILFITYYFTQVYIWNLFKGFVESDSTAVSGNQEPQPESVLPSQPSVASVLCEDRLEPSSEVKFSVYSLQSETWSFTTYT